MSQGFERVACLLLGMFMGFSMGHGKKVKKAITNSWNYLKKHKKS